MWQGTTPILKFNCDIDLTEFKKIVVSIADRYENLADNGAADDPKSPHYYGFWYDCLDDTANGSKSERGENATTLNAKRTNSGNILNFPKNRLTIDGKIVTLHLTESETFLLNPGTIYIQIRALSTAGDAIISNIMTGDLNRPVAGGVISE